MKVKFIVLKETKRKCSISDYRVFDIYNDKEELLMNDCDVVVIRCGDVSVDAYENKGVRYFYNQGYLEIEPLLNTLIIQETIKV